MVSVVECAALSRLRFFKLHSLLLPVFLRSCLYIDSYEVFGYALATFQRLMLFTSQADSEGGRIEALLSTPVSRLAAVIS